MDSIWSLAAQVGIFLLNTFITDLVRRERLKNSWEQFIKNRQTRANQTIELKDNLDEQSADLDQKQQELEKNQQGEH